MKFLRSLSALALILLSFSSLLATSQYEVAVCTIFQNEAQWLKEWIEFHKMQGIQHFYLYNNNSEDHFLEVLEPYLEQKEVTLVDWPYSFKHGDHDKWIKIQRAAYMDCVKTYGQETEWLACIDCDEFLFCPSGQKLPIFLSDYEDFGALCVNWLYFGTSYVEEIPDNFLMIELLTRCVSPEKMEKNFVKSIVQPKHVKSCLSAHVFKFKHGKFAVTADKSKSIVSNHSLHLELNKIRINHYWSKTEKYQRERFERQKKRRTDEVAEKLMKRAENFNKSSDSAILRFVPKLRKILGFSDQISAKLKE